MTARQFQNTLIEEPMQSTIDDLVARLGGLSFHLRNTSRSPEFEHFPDDLLILPSRSMIVFAELKSQKRAITPGQQLLLDMLSACTDAHTFLVRPEPQGPDEIAFDAFVEWLAS